MKKSTLEVTRVEAPVLDAVPELALTPAKPLEIKANFEQIEEYLISVRDKFKNVKMTSKTLDSVKLVKAEMRSVRVNLEKAEAAFSRQFFDDPKKIFKGRMSTLYPIIAEVEDKVDKIIAAEDEKRIDKINARIDAFICSNAADFTDEEIGKIILHKHFYNKTQPEADTLSDIEEQIGKIRAYAKEKADAIRQVTRACAKDSRLNVKAFLSLLEYKSLAGVLEEIDETLESFNPVPAAPVPAAPVPVIKTPEETEAVVISTHFDALSKKKMQKTKEWEVKFTVPVAWQKSFQDLLWQLDEIGIGWEG
jgi:hypothetical protein